LEFHTPKPPPNSILILLIVTEMKVGRDSYTLKLETLFEPRALRTALIAQVYS